MKKTILLVLLCSAALFAQTNFDNYFFDKALRFDFYHVGDKDHEQIVFDRMIDQPYWAGSKVNLVDTLQYGNYMFKVFTANHDTLLYSRGFSDLFQEWQSTEEAKTNYRVFPGTAIMPFPKYKVHLEIYKRNKQVIFEKLFDYDIDPTNHFISEERQKVYPNFKVHYSGEPSKKLDIVFIPEGYSAEEMSKFKEDCVKAAGYLFSYSPFKEDSDKINIWGIEAPSPESGTDIPGQHVWKRTLLNSNFYTFDSERYLMTTDYHNVCDVAANAPYDQIYILVNTEKYGGGAIYNYYSMTAAHHPVVAKILVHEFGHGLAGLADEYGSDDTYQDYYPTNVEPWEPNITTLVHFDKKWKNLVEESTPIPTPDTQEYYDKIGAFEGAGYVNKGVYRSTHDSLMRSFSSNEFNEVCKEVLKKVIDFYSN